MPDCFVRSGILKLMVMVVNLVFDNHPFTYAGKMANWLVPHQANLRIISATAKKLGMSMDNVVVTLDRHGNTSAASVPCALDEAVRDGRIKPGQLVLLEAFGGGFTWGSALVRF